MRASQAQQLLKFISAERPELVVVAADLNSTPPSPAYRILASQLTDTAGGPGPGPASWGRPDNTWTTGSSPAR